MAFDPDLVALDRRIAQEKDPRAERTSFAALFELNSRSRRPPPPPPINPAPIRKPHESLTNSPAPCATVSAPQKD